MSRVRKCEHLFCEILQTIKTIKNCARDFKIYFKISSVNTKIGKYPVTTMSK